MEQTRGKLVELSPESVSTKRLSTRHKIFLILISLGVLICFMEFNYISFYYQYAVHIFKMAYHDKDRGHQNDLILAQHEWKLYEYSRRFAQKLCQDVPPRKDFLWLTVLVNDAYVVPTIVLGHSIQTYSCHKSMVALVGADVSPSGRVVLRKVGWSIREVESLDCNWMDVQLGRTPQNKGIVGTHSRFHAWNLVNFSKIIYADSDYMPLVNIDELFDHPSEFLATYCASPGEVDPCFNAGLLSFKPSTQDYHNILNLWRELSKRVGCPNDQELLWQYFSSSGRWSPLSYAYNVRRKIFRPMKAFHFAGCHPPKPWSCPCRPSRQEAKEFKGSILNLRDMYLLFWRNLYDALEKYDLYTWWMSSNWYDPAQEFGDLSYKECWKELRYR